MLALAKSTSRDGMCLRKKISFDFLEVKYDSQSKFIFYSVIVFVTVQSLANLAWLSANDCPSRKLYCQKLQSWRTASWRTAF